MPPKLPSPDAELFLKSKYGDTLTVTLTNPAKDAPAPIEGTVIEAPANNTRHIAAGRTRYELLLVNGVLFVGKDGRTNKGETTEEGLMKTGTNQDGTTHYESGTSEKASWGFDYWGTGLDWQEGEELTLG